MATNWSALTRQRFRRLTDLSAGQSRVQRLGRKEDAFSLVRRRQVAWAKHGQVRALHGSCVGAVAVGRILLLPIVNQQERGVNAASSFPSQQVNRVVYSPRKLKRPEGRAPGAARMRPDAGVHLFCG